MVQKKRLTVMFLVFSLSLVFFVSTCLNVFYSRKISQFSINRELATFNADELKIGIITDIHFCDGVMNDLNHFLSRIDERDVDFNMSLGDNISFRLGNCDAYYREELPQVINQLREAKAPFGFVLGDHDIGSDVESVKFWKDTVGKDKNFYSFDKRNFHIVVLDTILGGEEMRQVCEYDGLCSVLENQYENLKRISKNQKDLKAYLQEKDMEISQFRTLLETAKKIYLEEVEKIKDVRSSGRRDVGRISKTELDWLEGDLAATEKEKVVVFSDHPLFHFVSPRKEYNIVNGDKVRKILENSQKKVVAISGEAHLWHEEKLNGVDYFIIDRFSGPEESFAVFDWDKDGFNLEKLNGKN